MSGLCGWSSGARAGGVAPSVIGTMSASVGRFESVPARTAAAASGALAIAGLASDLHAGAERLVAVWGPARFTDAELAALADRHGIAHALADGYQRRGTAVLPLLAGSFAVAIIDVASGETILAVDRIGTRPLIYAEAGEKLVFGSTLDAISAFPGMAPETNSQAIYDYIYFHMVPAPQTIHAGRRRMLPGTFLRWRSGKVEIERYWQLRFIENDAQPFGALKARFMAVLRESVREATHGAVTGAFLSGGTDSSTLAGLLGEVTGQPARTYSIGFEAEGYDEMHYARIAARHFGTQHHEYYVTPEDVVTAIPMIAAAHDQPFGNSSAVPTYYCAKLAKKDGVDVLLGGDGGDELFGGNERYAKQYLYSLYSDLPARLRTRFIEPVVFRAPAVSISGKVQRYMRNACEPMPARYDNYNLLGRLGAANVLTPEFLASVDPREPQTQMACAYDDAHAATLINRMLALDLRYTLADNDLPKVVRSCELAGVDVRFPMLADEVVAFSAKLAPGLKLKRTQLRYFFKKALSDFLPPQIIAKQKHGFGLPFGPWLQSHSRLQQLVGDSLQSLKGRDIVRRDFIEQLMSTHVADHPAYYGTMVWVLMMLEQWYQQHQVRQMIAQPA